MPCGWVQEDLRHSLQAGPSPGASHSIFRPLAGSGHSFTGPTPEAVMGAVHEAGQAGEPACGLSAATLVQRFGGKTRLKQSTLLHARDRLDEQTLSLATAIPKTPEGAIELMVGLSGQYGGIESYAKGLLLLREDLRDPVLRARGAAWKTTLAGVLDACFAEVPNVPTGTGLLAATHWQGALLWWSFDPQERVEAHVEANLRRFVSVLLTSGRGSR